MKVIDFIGKKVFYDFDSWKVFGEDSKGDIQNIVDIRGWGAIQHMFKKHNDAAKFQDELGVWIADAINEKLEREKLK